MGTRIQYKVGYILARRWKKAPKRVPRVDTILLRIRGGPGKRELDLYIRPDEAVAIITVLAAEVWNELIDLNERIK